jgi:hypothetical protein
LLVAWCLEWTGSYTAVFQILSAVIAAVAFAALLVTIPEAPPVLGGVAHPGDAAG